MAKFELSKLNGQFRFSLKASNGQIIATSELYSTKAAALRGIESVRKNATSALVETSSPADPLEPYLGQWVAMDGDEIIDHDDDPGALYARLTGARTKNTRFFRVGSSESSQLSVTA